jgi:hypothetical protein
MNDLYSISSGGGGGRQGFVCSQLRPDWFWSQLTFISGVYRKLLGGGAVRLQHEVDHSPRFSAKVKNAWSYPAANPYGLKACWLSTGTALPLRQKVLTLWKKSLPSVAFNLLHVLVQNTLTDLHICASQLRRLWRGYYLMKCWYSGGVWTWNPVLMNQANCRAFLYCCCHLCSHESVSVGQCSAQGYAIALTKQNFLMPLVVSYIWTSSQTIWLVSEQR